MDIERKDVIGNFKGAITDLHLRQFSKKIMDTLMSLYHQHYNNYPCEKAVNISVSLCIKMPSIIPISGTNSNYHLSIPCPFWFPV